MNNEETNIFRQGQDLTSIEINIQKLIRKSIKEGYCIYDITDTLLLYCTTLTCECYKGESTWQQSLRAMLEEHIMKSEEYEKKKQSETK